MLRPEDRLRPNRDEVAAEVMDGEAILIHLSTGVYYSMDKVGGALWSLIETGATLAETVAALGARYDAAPERVAADVRRVAEELLAEKLVVVTGDDTVRAEGPAPAPAVRSPYEPPRLNAYRDMRALLALDPPIPGFTDLPWKDQP